MTDSLLLSSFEFLDPVNEILWGPWTPYALLAAGVLFTVWTRFIQWTVVTHGVDVIRGRYDNPSDPGAINHFQALSAALSATVGLGNIGGVALAVGTGGPGALFWMWVVGVIGMALKAVEITLAMLYRKTDDPENPSGGAMWVVEQVLGSKGGIWKVIGRTCGVFFCITLVIATFTNGNMFQAWSVAELTERHFGVPKLSTGIAMALIVGLVIVGGIKRIGSVAGTLVPVMCLMYLVSAFVVLAIHVTDIPSLLMTVIRSAFQPTEAVGAFVGGTAGWGFIQGMKRAFFSNEAGLGSAPIAHAAAKTSEAAREGIVGGLGPFIDTLCICTLTGLVILCTGTWNREPIGECAKPLSVEKTAQRGEDTVVTFSVDSAAEPEDLPTDESGAWAVGDRFFVVGDAGDANQRETGSSRVKFFGEITHGQEPSITWEPLSVDPRDWDGRLGEITIVSAAVYRDYAGAELTAFAFDREFPGLGGWLVPLAAWLFAISSMISWSYYGEQGMIYLLGRQSVLPFKFVFLAGAVYAANWIENADEMVKLMDLGTGAMLWSNIPIVLALGYLAVGSLSDYRRKLAEGKFKRHDEAQGSRE
ncbi:Amino-acid carrier protein AlsT [Stieleria maiorica]|uniref:Amino-acid carrier protein AlsT n=1 Tax=Stieleria maiorica TaxID=2795974 RepID=A0A5B9MBF5_9BACT|nr:amino acid carrier protein [Stieleria maiorica]QEF97410.1 Amino-acid carrier protein AlsT [Stieleria maiorica]